VKEWTRDGEPINGTSRWFSYIVNGEVVHDVTVAFESVFVDYTFELFGELPVGLSVDFDTGAIGGSSSVIGDHYAVVIAFDETNNNDRIYTGVFINIGNAPASDMREHIWKSTPLPPGLSLNQTAVPGISEGAIIGTPTMAGTYVVVVSRTDPETERKTFCIVTLVLTSASHEFTFNNLKEGDLVPIPFTVANTINLDTSEFGLIYNPNDFELFTACESAAPRILYPGVVYGTYVTVTWIDDGLVSFAVDSEHPLPGIVNVIKLRAKRDGDLKVICYWQ
jgi:hypothetical protein